MRYIINNYLQRRWKMTTIRVSRPIKLRAVKLRPNSHHGGKCYDGGLTHTVESLQHQFSHIINNYLQRRWKMTTTRLSRPIKLHTVKSRPGSHHGGKLRGYTNNRLTDSASHAQDRRIQPVTHKSDGFSQPRTRQTDSFRNAQDRRIQPATQKTDGFIQPCTRQSDSTSHAQDRRKHY